MDEGTVRGHMDDLRERLKRIEAERDVILTLLKGYEGWLRLYPNGSVQQLPLPAKPANVSAQHRKPLSIRRAIESVIREARGEPLHVIEIWRRVEALGVTSNSKDKPAMVDYTMYALDNVEKVEPRTWRWVRPLNNA